MILDRLLHYQTVAQNQFTDLETAYYTEAVLKANAAGVMLGYEGRSGLRRISPGRTRLS